MSWPLNDSILVQLRVLPWILLGGSALACAGEVNGAIADGGLLESCLADLLSTSHACPATSVNAVEPEDDAEEPAPKDAGEEPVTEETVPTPSCELSDNLIQNASFTAGLTGWQPLDDETVVTQTHVESSADVPVDSGSLLVSLRLSSSDPAQAAVRVVSGTTQCFHISPSTGYEISAQVQLASALSASTQASFSVFFYAATGCEGELLNAWNSGSVEPRSEWASVNSHFVAPQTARSARLRLNASRLAKDPGGEILYDRVSLSSTSCASAPPQVEPEPEPAQPAPPPEPEAPLDGGVEPEPVAESSEPPEPESDPEPIVNPEPTPPEGPSYALTVEPIFAARCLESCHSPGGLGGPGLEGGDGPYPGISLNLVAGTGYAELTNGTFSAQAATLLLVGATVEESYLWHKLQNTHLSVGGAGLIMPFGAESLSAEELQSIRAWIEGGALP